MGINTDKTVTIAVGATQSAIGVDVGGFTLVGLYFPSTFDGTTVTLQSAPSINGTYVTVLDADGADLTLTVAASRFAGIGDLSLLVGVQYLKITAGSTQTTTDSIITLALREI